MLRLPTVLLIVHFLLASFRAPYVPNHLQKDRHYPRAHPILQTDSQEYFASIGRLARLLKAGSDYTDPKNAQVC